MKNYRLYELLPIIYRQRDLREGDPLHAFLNVMETELEAIEKNIEELYDNWFIETCDDWVVPYIGELLGIRNLATASKLLSILRLQVANTLRNRRQKGTHGALQNAIYDSTGWPAKVIPYFEKLSITQTLEHICLERGKIIDLHQVNQLELLNQPSDPFAHTIDVRVPDNNVLNVDYFESITFGKYNIKNIGIFLWQLRSFPIQFARARLISKNIQEKCYTFNPFRVDMPLFIPPPSYSTQNNSAANQSISRPLTKQDLPSQFSPPEAAQLLVDEHISLPPFQIFILLEDGSFLSKNQFKIQITDLSQWQIPSSPQSTPIAFVDLSLGRIALSANIKAKKVFVNYAYGFSANLGGGPYSRRQTLAVLNEATWRGKVARAIIPVSSQGNDRSSYSSLTHAIQEWSEQGRNGIIQICDNGLYDLEEDAAMLGEILVQSPRSWSLTIEAADGFSPCLLGNLKALGRDSGSQLVLNGLWIDGTIAVAGNLQLIIRHCTVRAKKAAIEPLSLTEEIESNFNGLEVTIAYSIVGSVHLPEHTHCLNIHDSIIDGGNQYAIASGETEVDGNWGSQTKIERTTVFGQSQIARIISANSVIFTDTLAVKHQQEGTISFSYVPDGSRTPPRYRCQPDLGTVNTSEGMLRNARQRACKPIFVSRIYGDPAYAKLSYTTPSEILTGAANGMEMGVFNNLAQPQRLESLQVTLKENFPYGLTEKLVIGDR